MRIKGQPIASILWALFLSISLAFPVFFASCDKTSKGDAPDPDPIEGVEDGAIRSFGFLKKDNPTLMRDISCELDKNTLTFTGRSAKLLPEKVDASALVATFEADGEVSVNGVRQESGVTVNDFTKPVTYTLLSKDGEKREYVVEFVNYTGIPIVYVNTPTGYPLKDDITSKEEWKEATIRVDGNGAFDDLPETGLKVRGRGNITWGWDKKPFNLKFDKKAEILGMPEHKRWCMLANYADITMLRNDIAFHVSNLTSLEWAPRGRFVELVFNGKYNGTYYLTEHVRVDENRVDVHELEPGDSDITGGYLVEMDFHWDESPFQWRPTVDCRQPANACYIVKAPDEDDITPEQFNYIKDYISEFERVIQSDKLSDPDEGYKKYIDPQSFVDYWLVFETCINHEIWNPGSVYLHKDRGGKLVAGPVWDFDFGTFNFTYEEAMPARYSLYVKDAIWYKYLFRDPDMKALAKKRWEELKPELAKVPEYIKRQGDYLRYAAAENLRLWPMTITTNGDAALTYSQAVDRLMEVWDFRMDVIDKCVAEW